MREAGKANQRKAASDAFLRFEFSSLALAGKGRGEESTTGALDGIRFLLLFFGCLFFF